MSNQKILYANRNDSPHLNQIPQMFRHRHFRTRTRILKEIFPREDFCPLNESRAPNNIFQMKSHKQKRENVTFALNTFLLRKLSCDLRNTKK